MLGGHVGDEPHLVLPGLRWLVVVEMAGVVSQFVDMRGHVDGEPVVFLQVDGEVGLRAGPDGGQGCGVGLAIDGDPHDARPGGMQGVGLVDRGGHVGGVGGRHALGSDGVAGPDRDAPDPHGPRWISL